MEELGLAVQDPSELEYLFTSVYSQAGTHVPTVPRPTSPQPSIRICPISRVPAHTPCHPDAPSFDHPARHIFHPSAHTYAAGQTKHGLYQDNELQVSPTSACLGVHVCNQL